MSRGAARPLAWSLLGIYVGLAALTVTLELTGEIKSFESVFAIFTVGYAICGTLIASRQPRNPIGWIMLALALLFALNSVVGGYVESVDDPASLAGGTLAAWFYVWNELLWIPLVGIFLPLVFPDGRLPSRRWRPLLWLTVCAVAFSAAGQALKPGLLEPSEWPGLENPLGVGVLGEATEIARVVGAVLAVPAFLAAVASVVVRLRHARGDERQQIKWFAYTAALMGAALLVAVCAEVLHQSMDVDSTWAYVLGAVGWFTALFLIVFGIPIAAGLAIFKYRLYDIDVVVNRTLVYGSLTAALALAYLGSVLLLQLLLQPLTEESDLAIAGSTLAVAALFRPLRTRIQAAVDRRFYRRRYDAARTLDAFGMRLRDELDLDTLGAELRGVVRETMQPAHVSLWVREAGR